MRDLIIYRIVNTVNGKCYVGQSTQGLVQRRAEHLARAAGADRDHRLYQAIRKHGESAFEFEVLCHVLREEDLNDLEIALIAEYGAYGRRGYNMNAGGNGVSAETREKIRKANIGRKITWGDKIGATRRARGYRSKGLIPAGEASTLAKCYLVQAPGGRLFAIEGLRAFCRENGLDHKTLLDTMKGVQRHHKGFVLLSPLGLNKAEGKSATAKQKLLVGAE